MFSWWCCHRYADGAGAASVHAEAAATPPQASWVALSLVRSGLLAPWRCCCHLCCYFVVVVAVYVVVVVVPTPSSCTQKLANGHLLCHCLCWHAPSCATLSIFTAFVSTMPSPLTIHQWWQSSICLDTAIIIVINNLPTLLSQYINVDFYCGIVHLV